MDKIGTEEKLTEIRWCDHLRVTPSPLVLVLVPHIYLHGQKAYLVIEENKVKLVCPDCWWVSTRTHIPFN